MRLAPRALRESFEALVMQETMLMGPGQQGGSLPVVQIM